MIQKAFRNFYFGFLFVMIDFRLNGFDILPDIIGYIFFVVGLSSLLNINEHFSKARIYHIIMLVLSFFSIEESGRERFDPIDKDDIKNKAIAKKERRVRVACM